MNRQIERVFSKPCKWCGKNAIFWSDMKKCFTETPDGERHSCPPSSKIDQNKHLNEMLNDLKSEISNKFSDEVQRIDSLQKSVARNTSILTEIKAKLDMVLRGG